MSFLKAFFADPNRWIHCPFCQGSLELPVDKSTRAFKSTTGHPCTWEQCKRMLPPEFLERYDEAPALFVPMMGWRNAGKSSFLMMVIMMLDRAYQIWGDYEFEALTEETHRAVKKARIAVKKHELPQSTPIEVGDTYLCHLLGLPRWGSRTWIVRDVPGEDFEKFTIPAKQSSFVSKAQTALLFLDPAGHLEEAGNSTKRRGEGLSMEDLIKAYTKALTSQGQSFKTDCGRKVIVVITKGNHVQNLPEKIRDYLEKDVLQKPFSSGLDRVILTDAYMADYMAKLTNVSRDIREWLSNQPGGLAFLQHAKNNHIELRFCIVAAIPSGVDEKNVPLAGMNPLRILDPLFWALELNCETSSAPLSRYSKSI